jgi:hypothetical protein
MFRFSDNTDAYVGVSGSNVPGLYVDGDLNCKLLSIVNAVNASKQCQDTLVTLQNKMTNIQNAILIDSDGRIPYSAITGFQIPLSQFNPALYETLIDWNSAMNAIYARIENYTAQVSILTPLASAFLAWLLYKLSDIIKKLPNKRGRPPNNDPPNNNTPNTNQSPPNAPNGAPSGGNNTPSQNGGLPFDPNDYGEYSDLPDSNFINSGNQRAQALLPKYGIDSRMSKFTLVQNSLWDNSSILSDTKNAPYYKA